MPVFVKKAIQHMKAIKKVEPLQVQQSLNKITSTIILRKWVSLYASLHQIKKTASLTVEASLALMLFLSASISFIYMFQIIGLQESIQSSLEYVGDEISQYAYLAEVEDDDPQIMLQLGVIYAKEKLITTIGREKLDRSIIKNGSAGISMIGSSIFWDGKHIDLVASYQVTIPLPLIHLQKLYFVQRSRKRAWVGREGNEQQESEIMVYVTSSGAVYHRQLSCKHLNTTIEEVNRDELKELRSQDGSIYYPCQICKPLDQNGWNTYITPYGNRYHWKISCRELTVEIRSIPLSEAEGLRGCKDCS